MVCNANFPSVWLLEQHAALQHANLGPFDEKPFICEQCGQSYRYRSAYVKHREQNHRARLPADKLFTCDVCGMQFRYLKSFKKHRLNHALERLHGKFERRWAQIGQTSTEKNINETNSANNSNETNNNEMVTSSNETLTTDIAELQFTIKTEEEDEEDQDNTIDSPTTALNMSNDRTEYERNTPTNLTMVTNLTDTIVKQKLSSTEQTAIMANRPMSRDENSFILKVNN